MSLLMDALRKAEQQKQKQAAQAQGEQLAPSSGLELEPISLQEPPQAAAESPLEAEGPTAPPPPSTPDIFSQTNGFGPKKNRLQDLPTRLEDLDEQFIAHAAEPPLKKPAAATVAPTPPAPPTPTPAPSPAAPVREKKIETSPESARKLFDAKQPSPPKGKNNFVLAVSLLGLVAGLGIGGYLWWEMQPKGVQLASGAAPAAPVAAIKPPPPPPPPPATPAPAASAPPVAVAAAPAPTVAAAPQPAPAAAASPAKPASAPQADADDDEIQAVRPAKRERAPAAVAAPKPDSPVRVSSAPKKTDPGLEQAYQAFNSGDMELARSSWKKVLASDPRNSDALHGMAALALQSGQPAQAAELYLRALETDPKDALALSGLLALKAPSDVLQAESRLKTLLAEQPDSSHLNFALGNLYARGSRWAEAQQSYFKAHTADPANPDYLFNLAVSLDQLHQPKLAAQYYGQAIEATARQPAGFDTAQAATRLKALQSGQ